MNVLSIKLTQRTTVLVAGVLLMVVVALLVQPGIANAQPADERPVVVVNPGDTLWSISQQRLHPNATPQEINEEMWRIHMLSRSQIGDDPNLLLAGQELLLPPLAAEPTAPTAPATTAEPATEAEPTAVAERAPAAGPVEEPAITLPDMPGVELMSVTSTVAESSLLESYGGIQRRTLGLGIIALTIILAILMAWRLPMNRPVGGSSLWGTPSGYGDSESHGYSENYALLHSDSADTASANEQNSGPQEENTNHEETPQNASEDESTRDQIRSALQAVNFPEEANPKNEEAAIEMVEELIRGTAVGEDELELASLRKLPLNEQLALGIVLREAGRQKKFPYGRRQERLARVSSVQEARSFLERG